LCFAAPLKADPADISRSVQMVAPAHGQEAPNAAADPSAVRIFMVDLELPVADVMSPSDIGAPGLRLEAARQVGGAAERGPGLDRQASGGGGPGDAADTPETRDWQASVGAPFDIASLGSDSEALDPGLALASPIIRMYVEDQPKLENLGKDVPTEQEPVEHQRPQAYRPAAAPKIDRPRAERPRIELPRIARPVIAPSIIYHRPNIAPHPVAHEPRRTAAPRIAVQAAPRPVTATEIGASRMMSRF
jgi:hypothetical protein